MLSLKFDQTQVRDWRQATADSEIMSDKSKMLEELSRQEASGECKDILCQDLFLALKGKYCLSISSTDADWPVDLNSAC